jgi:hypothetical protein
MSLGLVISAFVSNADKALTILPVILFAEFLLTGAVFNVRTTPGLDQLSYVTSARWGFAAAASTSNLDRIEGLGCNGTGPPPGPAASCDPTHRHATSTWSGDVLVLVALTVAGVAGACIAVRPIGQPRRR